MAFQSPLRFIDQTNNPPRVTHAKPHETRVSPCAVETQGPPRHNRDYPARCHDQKPNSKRVQNDGKERKPWFTENALLLSKQQTHKGLNSTPVALPLDKHNKENKAGFDPHGVSGWDCGLSILIK